MSELNRIPTSISHKKLNALMIKAYKEKTFIDPLTNQVSEDLQNFNELTKTWAKLTQEILCNLHKKKRFLTEGKSPNSLMALGAMEVHLNMAIQALKTSEKED
tara:strand:+ start:51 stop:359 length:309 start_codon:yes stop_codon:yes gene_type:complete